MKPNKTFQRTRETRAAESGRWMHRMKYKNHILCAVCLILSGCSTIHRSPLEKEFERQKNLLIRTDLDWIQESCRGTGATAYSKNSEIVMIAAVIGTSQRWIYRDFYFKNHNLALVVQHTWFLLDDAAKELEKPKMESETRFYFDEKHLSKTQGDPPAVESGEKEMFEEATELFKLAQKK